MAKANPQITAGIRRAARELGVNPLDLATAISYETAGTFDPTKRGPRTKWGQHQGLIQFGEPQAKQYGVDWSNPIQSQLGSGGAVVKYLRDAGVKPGMGLLDIYSAINAGGVGLYDRSDEAVGGAPGTVRDKVRNQMTGHRRKAARLLGAGDVATDSPSPAPRRQTPPHIGPPRSAPAQPRRLGPVPDRRGPPDVAPPPPGPVTADTTLSNNFLRAAPEPGRNALGPVPRRF